MQKRNFVPRMVFVMLKFKKSCNLIDREHFFYNLSRRFSQNIQLLQNHKDNYGASCKPKNDAPMEQIFLPTPKSPTFKDISGFFLKIRFL